MARRQEALGSPLQLRGPADRSGSLQVRRGGRPQAGDVGPGDCRLSPSRVDESGGTRTAVSSTRCPRDRFSRPLAYRPFDRMAGKCQIERARSARPKTMATVTFEDFQRVEMRVGRIVAADDFPEARNPSYKLRIDRKSTRLNSSHANISYAV